MCMWMSVELWVVDIGCCAKWMIVGDKLECTRK